MVRITMEDGGIIDIELNEEVAPITCENFKKLVKEGFYNGLTFHRVIPGFMIQVLLQSLRLVPVEEETDVLGTGIHILHFDMIETG